MPALELTGQNSVSKAQVGSHILGALFLLALNVTRMTPSPLVLGVGTLLTQEYRWIGFIVRAHSGLYAGNANFLSRILD